MPKPFNLDGIDPIIHSPVRLGIMSILAGGDEVEFTLLRDRLGITDGNLSTHLRKLEEASYVKCKKSFLGRRPRTTYRMITKGRKSFENHLAVLEKIVNRKGME